MEATDRPLHDMWKISTSISKAIGKVSDMLYQLAKINLVHGKSSYTTNIHQTCPFILHWFYIIQGTNLLFLALLLKKERHFFKACTFCVWQFHGALMHIIFSSETDLTSHYCVWLKEINVKAHVNVSSLSCLANRQSPSKHLQNICMQVRKHPFNFIVGRQCVWNLRISQIWLW